jgi:hypothetical protein
MRLLLSIALAIPWSQEFRDTILDGLTDSSGACAPVVNAAIRVTSREDSYCKTKVVVVLRPDALLLFSICRQGRSEEPTRSFSSCDR